MTQDRTINGVPATPADLVRLWRQDAAGYTNPIKRVLLIVADELEAAIFYEQAMVKIAMQSIEDAVREYENDRRT